MRRYEYDKDICDGWKSYPIRITGAVDRVSKCCRTILAFVQSMEGGFVTANCLKCGRKETIIEDEFKKLPFICCCPECKHVMKAETIEKNYCYVCHNCNLYIRLADLLPHWSDLGI
jgi:hypothetical protein